MMVAEEGVEPSTDTTYEAAALPLSYSALRSVTGPAVFRHDLVGRPCEAIRELEGLEWFQDLSFQLDLDLIRFGHADHESLPVPFHGRPLLGCGPFERDDRLPLLVEELVHLVPGDEGVPAVAPAGSPGVVQGERPPLG